MTLKGKIMFASVATSSLTIRRVETQSFADRLVATVRLGLAAHRQRAALAQLALQGFKTAQQFDGAFAHRFAFGRGADAARGALEQPQAQTRFDRGQPLGRRRCGHAQRPGRGGERAVLADGLHQFQVGTVQLLLF